MGGSGRLVNADGDEDRCRFRAEHDPGVFLRLGHLSSTKILRSHPVQPSSFRLANAHSSSHGFEPLCICNFLFLSELHSTISNKHFQGATRVSANISFWQENPTVLLTSTQRCGVERMLRVLFLEQAPPQGLLYAVRRSCSISQHAANECASGRFSSARMAVIDFQSL